jgi:mannose-6-phosphate isomerase-like protein (cupin superfamily)
LASDFLAGYEEGHGYQGKPAILTIQRLSAADFTTLQNSGFRSFQIVWPNNAPDARVTITRVTMEPGATSARHVHLVSEQIWLIEQGNALLLMADGQTDGLRAGDVVRSPAGTIHGVTNTGAEPFVYLAVTTPPQDFSPAYKGPKTSN